MTPQAILMLLCIAAGVLLIVRATMGGGARRYHGPDVGSSMTIGGREVQEDYVGTLATPAGLLAVLADGMGKTYGARIASRTAVETCLDLFRDYNAFDNPQYYFRKAFHAANRAILRELGDEGYGAASVGAAMIQDNWLFYAAVGNVKLCVYRGGDLVPVSAGHTLDVLAEEHFQTGRLSREDALAMLENHRLYNYLGQDGFKDIEIFDRPIALQKGDIIVLMSDGLYELIPWKEIEDVLAGGEDCQSMAYALIEKVNQNTAEDRDNASIILIRWDGSGRGA
ncbi:PP2C family serine/threonine-protein phosphatase [Intestinimonas sp.]|uniref:PP2C family protein-serine/threonine phosphatase n=1 Tax=Intestinimonas sp. TaxID=1965293 RepID=UPI002624E13A|nr:protein phosphatase 2C domain-containing protein [Intestinimonas sp.]